MQLTPTQKRFIDNFTGPSVISGPPASGKTTAIIFRAMKFLVSIEAFTKPSEEDQRGFYNGIWIVPNNFLRAQEFMRTVQETFQAAGYSFAESSRNSLTSLNGNINFQFFCASERYHIRESLIGNIRKTPWDFAVIDGIEAYDSSFWEDSSVYETLLHRGRMKSLSMSYSPKDTLLETAVRRIPHVVRQYQVLPMYEYSIARMMEMGNFEQLDYGQMDWEARYQDLIAQLPKHRGNVGDIVYFNDGKSPSHAGRIVNASRWNKGVCEYEIVPVMSLDEKDAPIYTRLETEIEFN